MNWYHQYTPGDMWDYDEEGAHILIDATVGGQTRKIVSHAARNGFLYSFERANGQTVVAKPYLQNINWTAGIDQKTGKPVDYDPNRDIQVYSGQANYTLRPSGCAQRSPAATTISRRPIAAAPDSSTSRPTPCATT
jgi:alcohol dehydrogenase (cytochrome c)